MLNKRIDITDIVKDLKQSTGLPNDVSLLIQNRGSEKMLIGSFPNLKLRTITDVSTNYNIVSGDSNKTFRLTGSTSRTLTLPDSNIGKGLDISIINDSTVNLIVNTKTSDPNLIDGQDTYTIPSGSAALFLYLGSAWTVTATYSDSDCFIIPAEGSLNIQLESRENVTIYAKSVGSTANQYMVVSSGEV